MATVYRDARVIRSVFGALFGMFSMGCEMDLRSNSDGSTPSATETAVASSTDTVSEEVPVAPVTESVDTTSGVLNDDPNCNLVVKYKGHAIPNTGQVHYLQRVLVSDPFGSANPICVQYNDTQTGEVTVWKNPSSTGQRVNVLPSDRGIDKIVVWYE